MTASPGGRPQPSLYDRLGVDPEASAQELRAGYRRQARRLHPDVAVVGSETGGAADGPASTGDAMRRLNEAWAVLGDPQRRRRYDEARMRRAGVGGEPSGAGGSPAAPSSPGASPYSDREWTNGDGETEAFLRPRLPFVRPSALILVVLAIIFVVTAYAGTWPGSNTTTSPATTTAAGGSAGSSDNGNGDGSASRAQVVGQCVAKASRAAGVVVTTGAGGLPIGAVVPCSTPNDGQILAQVTVTAPCPAGTTGYAGPQPLVVLCAAGRTSP